MTLHASKRTPNAQEEITSRGYATDSIIDIMSFFILWETLDIDTVYSTAVTEGAEQLLQHGVMPVPVPCRNAIKIRTAIPFSQDFDIHTELVTPTGSLLRLSAQYLHNLQNLTATKVGYGFGKRDTGTPMRYAEHF